MPVMLPPIASAAPAVLAAAGGPVLDLPVLAVGWGLALWWVARWLAPPPSRGTERGVSADRATQEPAYACAGQQHRGGDQGEQHDQR